MMKLHDNVPVLELPDGRRAVADTGCSGADILANVDSGPLNVNGNEVHLTVAPVDLRAIARGIGAERVDLLIGTSLLYEGFTVDLRNGTFEFSATNLLPDEEIAAVLPYARPNSGAVQSPIVELEVGTEKVSGVFDTGAAYSLWKLRSAEPNRPAESNRRDFHLAEDGHLVDFDVWMRKERVRIEQVTFDLDVAYLPESWPAINPDCVFGMDIPEALGATRFVLDPETREFRFYRSR
jgi:hypothetical protein